MKVWPSWRRYRHRHGLWNEPLSINPFSPVLTWGDAWDKILNDSFGIVSTQHKSLGASATMCYIQFPKSLPAGLLKGKPPSSFNVPTSSLKYLRARPETNNMMVWSLPRALDCCELRSRRGKKTAQPIQTSFPTPCLAAPFPPESQAWEER